MSNKSEIKKIPVFLADWEEEHYGKDKFKNTHYLVNFNRHAITCLGVFGQKLMVFRRSDFTPDEREAIERGETHPFTYKPRRKTGYEKRLPLLYLYDIKERHEKDQEEIEKLSSENIKLKNELKRVKAEAKSKKKGKVKK